MRFIRYAVTTVFILTSFCAVRSYAEEQKSMAITHAVDEKLYEKDTVPVDETYACQIGMASACEMPVLVDKVSKKIEYYRSDKDSNWVKAGDQQQALQALYDKREELREERRIKAMQEEMDGLRHESMGEKMEGTPAHR